MADDQKDDKTEDASEKKIQDALEKGQTPVSRELSIFASLLAVLTITTFTLTDNVRIASNSLAGLLSHSGEISLNSVTDLNALEMLAGSIVLKFALPFFIALMLAGIASAVFQNPPSIVWDRVTPKLSHISLIKGRERIFSVKGFVEFLKSTFKIGLSVAVIYFMTSNFIQNLMNGLYSDSSVFLASLQIQVVKIITSIVVTMALITGFDIFWSRSQWKNDLKMSKQEVKDEMKQAMGDPMQRSRQRSMALDRSRNRMMSAIPAAAVIIANPTHFSVALRYDPEKDPAPVVVAMGRDLIALRIREIGKTHEVPIIENVQLARGLYKISKLDHPIPAEFFPAVAQILAFLRKNAAQNARKGAH